MLRQRLDQSVDVHATFYKPTATRESGANVPPIDVRALQIPRSPASCPRWRKSRWATGCPPGSSAQSPALALGLQLRQHWLPARQNRVVFETVPPLKVPTRFTGLRVVFHLRQIPGRHLAGSFMR